MDAHRAQQQRSLVDAGDVSGILAWLREGRRLRRRAVVYTVNGDESHEGKARRVFAAAGLFGSQEDWDATEAAWLIRTGGKIFHASECECDQGDFAGIDHKENQKLYKDLTQIIAQSKLCGFGAGIDVAGHREFFPDAIDECSYHKCFLEVLIHFGELAYISIPQDKVKFTFDQRIETNYSAGQLYQWTVNQPEWKLTSFYHDAVEFGTRRSPGIQMADLLARETMKELDNGIGPVKRDMRRSMRALVDKGQPRFSFKYFMREYFEDFKKKFPDVEAAAQLDMGNYGPWLSTMGLTDCWTSRIRYVTDRKSVV